MRPTICSIFFSIELHFKSVGLLKSVFHQKTGTPRQGSVCKNSRGSLTIDSSVFNNPEHSLDGLLEYSHIWWGQHWHLPYLKKFLALKYKVLWYDMLCNTLLIICAKFNSIHDTLQEIWAIENSTSLTHKCPWDKVRPRLHQQLINLDKVQYCCL